MKKVFVALFACSLLFHLACDEGKSSKSEDAGKLLAFGVVSLNSIWQKVTVADVPGFSFTNKDGDPMTPSCACPPELEGLTGETTTYNPDFAFFYKPGATNNLLIFFMGGGACWDITNCAYNHTYSGALFESTMILGLGSKGTLVNGIIDSTNENNPFRDWTMVWVPYCTADLGAGQNDYTYTDDYGTLYPEGVTIKHRGRVNLELVLQWMQANITTAPDKLFVTGSSAGAYTTFLSFPLVRNLFNSTSTKAYVLGDAGEGVAGEYDPDGSGSGVDPVPFMETVEPLWGLELPLNEVAGSVFDGQTPESRGYSYKTLVQDIVTYYSADKFAQYTTKWDKTQVWFYNIQKDNNIHHPEVWGAEDAADPAEDISTEWMNLMIPAGGAIDITGANYWYYIGPGKDHTIMLTPRFYTEIADGEYFFDWVTNFVNEDGPMANRVCADCPFVP